MTVADQIMAYMESRPTSDPVFKPELVRANFMHEQTWRQAVAA